jgi:poly(A) polymerase Pap1
VDPSSEIAREIARDAVKILTALMEQLKRAFETAKSEARKAKSLKRLQEVRKHLDHYIALMRQMRDEIETEDASQIVGDLLMEVV